MTGKKLGVGVLGAHTWAEKAHLPGYANDPRVDLVAVCDVVPERAAAMAKMFNIRKVYTKPEDLIADPEVQMVDVCTPTDTHYALGMAAIEAGKHVLCEKPIARSATEAFALARAAEAAKVRTKVGFTFRYSPALRQIRAWIEDGTLGEIFHIHGLEQNSQFLDPYFPLRQVPQGADFQPKHPIPMSIVGYGSHLVDLVRWMGGEYKAVVSSMSNYMVERTVRGYEGLQKINVDDGTVALVEFASGAQGMLQTSIVAVGNYPGIEIRVYGSKAAAVGRLVTERGIAETLHFATADKVEFEPVTLPDSHFPPGTSLRTEWRELYYRNLVRLWIGEILENRPPEGDFLDGARSQEIVDACVMAHVERRWVDLPLYPDA
ncbi:Gfo/Idh/MocA family oxidoreductase [uncultured Alsobacter sp.]|uniref:Gfo/Idh/MocA family protein n=1 Tax=uncultured Alsobacter sp. TaxID=1748258 RepID=UPI0025FDE2A3|nr:Gfo/Idh/MocA family oxidoreductase [uncultured Alsobacter sp.]